MSCINSPFLLPSKRTIVEYPFLTQITCPYRILREDLSGKVRRTGIVFTFMFFLWDDGQTNKFCRCWEVFKNFHARSRYRNVLILHVTFKCCICIKNRFTSPSVELSFIVWPVHNSRSVLLQEALLARSGTQAAPSSNPDEIIGDEHGTKRNK